jgi:hypothetical protein
LEIILANLLAVFAEDATGKKLFQRRTRGIGYYQLYELLLPSSFASSAAILAALRSALARFLAFICLLLPVSPSLLQLTVDLLVQMFPEFCLAEDLVLRSCEAESRGLHPNVFAIRHVLDQKRMRV